MRTIEISEPFAYRDLARLGITRRRLRTMLSDGTVRRIVREVYAPAALTDELDLRARAIALTMPAGQVVCDRTAAWIYGIDLYTYAEHETGLVAETCVGPGREPSHRTGVDGHRRGLREDEVTDVHGVAVTTPLRTALDLACILERRDAMAALDAFRRTHDLSAEALSAAVLRRFRGRRGVVQARQLIPLSDPRAESIRESWLRITIIDAGLPVPEPQFWVNRDGLPAYRLDLAYPRMRVAAEYDGQDGHYASEEQIRADEERRSWLRAQGWTVIVVRSGDFTGARLERWLAELRRALQPSYSNRRRLERGSNR
jgi:hypothetical protein